MSDIVFPHTAQYEIPLLDIGRQGKFFELPVAGWGHVSRKSRFKGTWHFYVDDSKFSALWKHPEAVLKTRAVCAVEPNFSTHEQMQFPVALHRIYQKRWVARWWQEQEMPVFVDLYVAQQYEALNLHGVPRGWRSYATRGNDDRLAQVARHLTQAQEHSDGLPLNFLVYGGADKTAKFCEQNDLVHVRDARNEARNG